jgi:CheY-like chemotaxis protein
MKEDGHFSFSVRCEEGGAVMTVVDQGRAIGNEILASAFQMALSRRGGARTYSMRMPLDGARATTPPPTYGARPRRRILVVDDNTDAAHALGLLLGHLGHDVQVTHDGHAALEAARLNRPHVVLLDLGMPGVDGYGVVERLRRDPQFAGVRFVAVTGSSDRERCLVAGFDEHLVKPVNLERLRELLERL